jgi:hypothetical protein
MIIRADAGYIKYNEAVRAGNPADPDRYLS